MPRPSKGPYLYLKKRKDRPPYYVIRDGGREISIGGSATDREAATAALGQYFIDRIDPRPKGECRPDQMTIATAMDIYLREYAEGHDKVRISYSADRILDFWGEMTVSQVRGETCRRYGRERAALGRKPGTIRNELSCLKAALRHCVAEGYLSTAPIVTLPGRTEPKQDWWTRPQAAAVLRAARSEPRLAHVVLFVLIGLYTGTRPGAILKLQWQPNLTGGWIDLENRVMYRKPVRKGETTKRQPAIRIPPRLYRFLVYARRRTTQYAVEYRGKPVKLIRGAFRKCCRLAGVTGTPHVLRHTCATWLMQRGVDVYMAAGFLGMSVQTMIDVYAKQHPDYQAGAVNAFNRRKG